MKRALSVEVGAYFSQRDNMQQALRPVAGRPAAFRQRQPATLLVRSSLGSGAGASTSTSPKGSTLLYDKLQGIKVRSLAAGTLPLPPLLRGPRWAGLAGRLLLRVGHGMPPC